MAPPSKASDKFKPLTLETTSFSYSLTDGTNIPPPPPSPPPQQKKLSPNANGTSHPTTPNGEDTEMKDAPADGSMPPPAKKQQIPPTSPTSTTGKRPSSVRKLLSLKSMRDRNSIAVGNGNGKLSTDSRSPSVMDRPGSPYGASVMSNDSRPSLAKKRSSGWFGSRRKSNVHMMDISEQQANGGAVQPPAKKGPPPPTLPEFREFGSLDSALNGGSLGTSADDMFKNIK